MQHEVNQLESSIMELIKSNFVYKSLTRVEFTEKIKKNFIINKYNKISGIIFQRTIYYTLTQKDQRDFSMMYSHLKLNIVKLKLVLIK